MKNLTGLMKQAAQMQQKMQEMQERLDAAEVEGMSGAGLVRLTLNGQGALKSIKIDPKLADPAETEMLEDLILAAHNDAKAKLEAVKESEMRNATGGLTLPPGMKLPF
jgi:DNA-binding YbaB/EbfC family protein